MAHVNPTRYDLSASSVQAFKACPVRFKLGYREGLRVDGETDSQRTGTNWHGLHEVYAAHHGDDPTNPLEVVINHLNERYAAMPASKTPEEWALERQILLTSFVGYLWFYQDDPIEILASEVAFELPVIEPKTGMPLPLTEARRVGKIDHVIRWQNMVGTIERKSTSRSIDSDSDYWDKARKDTQVSMYALAFRDMNAKHCAENTACSWLPGFSTEPFGSTLYDVWHKPTIKPAVLSQKDTLEFVRTGMYMGQQFTVKGVHPDKAVEDGGLTINGEKPEVEQGKKGFAIRETIEMYGARLLADIQERPGFYFQRREIARTDADLIEFRKELFAVYQTQKLMEKHNTWFSNESQCRATFPCPYIPICYGPGHEAVADGKTTPPTFKRIFVDLTVNGQEQEE